MRRNLARSVIGSPFVLIVFALVLLAAAASAVPGCGAESGGAAAQTSGTAATTSGALSSSVVTSVDLGTVVGGPAPGAVTSTGVDGQQRDLLVSAAAGLKNAFTELGRVFDSSHDTKTTFNFAAAGVLEKQIEAGAPADVFASSDPKFIDLLVRAGLLDSSSVTPFATNRIVLIVPADSTADISCFADLAEPNVRKVATGDPNTTPLGAATLEILPALEIEASVISKLVYTETVNQTLTYVIGGDVDAGIVWSSEALAGGDKIHLAATADPAWYAKVEFDLGLIGASSKKKLGQEFIDFVLSDEGQSILKRYGWSEVPSEP